MVDFTLRDDWYGQGIGFWIKRYATSIRMRMTMHDSLIRISNGVEVGGLCM